MTDATLVPCPLCGESKGYRLDEGSTYRWWSVKCAACGEQLSEARATYPAETTPRTANADAAWNEAGKHAQALRDTIKRLEAQLRAARVIIDGADRRGVNVAQAMFKLQEQAADVQGERDANAILTEEVERLEAENAALRRGEFICSHCGLRKDAEQSGAVPF